MPEPPAFASPPVVEMALGVQFRRLHGVRGITLGPLREQWRSSYPRVEEQPPLAPAIEGPAVAAFTLQLGLGPLPAIRHWFLTEDETELVQVQNDRLIVNWREGNPPTPYPRYPHMRELFERRLRELAGFVEEHDLGALEIIQAELNYINAVDPPDGQLGGIGHVLRGWSPPPYHHLGEPEQARVGLVFAIPHVGQPPARMYVDVNPAQRPDGSPTLFLTLTARGAPGSGTIGATLDFMDQGHDHLVRSFMELTAEPIQAEWSHGE
jgi:uncharacterized protein (TIGR04255 family)